VKKVIRVGETYLAVDPAQTTGNRMDLHRIWAGRIPVVVCRVHYLKIRYRYDVRASDGTEFSTGRLERRRKVVRQGGRVAV
jgi:hypothetical protein